MKIYITACDKRVAYAKKVKEMMVGCPYEYFFVYGRGNTNKVEPYLEFDFEEAYERLPEKTFCIAEHFLKNFKDEKLVKMNDDTYLDWEKLKKYEDSPEDYIGYLNTYGEDHYSKFFHWYKIENPEYRVFKRIFKVTYAEGAMYILSRKACEKILKEGRLWFQNTPEDYLGEDIRVGVAMDDSSIVKKDIKYPSQLCYEITEDLVSVHPVNLMMFDKLREAKTQEEKTDILIKYHFVNENVLRLEYLRKIDPVVKPN